MRNVETMDTGVERDPLRLFAPPAVVVEKRADGATIVRSSLPPAAHARCTGAWLRHWAQQAPERDFLLERDGSGSWQRLSYGNALRKSQAVATWLLTRNLSPERPLVVLSDNSVEHALLMLAAMDIGVPIAAVSPAYSLQSKDHAKLKRIIELLRPGVIYVNDVPPFLPALRALHGLHDALLLVGGEAGLPADLGASLPFSETLANTNEAAVCSAFDNVGPDTIAKFLFTSGSTGEPKAVINTQRMLCSSQEAKRQLWPFLATTPPVIVDWLPWNHTFGANHNFNLVLRNGGTLYIDAGKPLPPLFDKTLANLREIQPSIYFNVPRGLQQLVAALAADAALRQNFFSRLQVIFYAAAALPQNVWDELASLSWQTLGVQVAMVSAWGTTETSPLATDCHFQAERSGVIGLPVPGVSLKLVPSGNKQEIRVKGANITPGYWKRADLTAQAFDDEGYYITGDAVRFADPARPESGLVFDGRIAEDFKLSTGTWVSVGLLRIKAIEALAPVAQDIVVAGHDRDDIGFLIFPNVIACRGLCGDLAADAPLADVLLNAVILARVRAGLARLRDRGGGSSSYARFALLMAEPPSIDAGEITDKGYINQRAVLAYRARLAERLYERPMHASVIAL